MSTPLTPAVRGRPGRPRSAHAHEAILDAALELLERDGFAGMSMEAVAQRAGVGKATIYRRWASKEQLVVEAVGCVRAVPPPPDTGSAAEDLLATLRRQVARAADVESSRLMLRLISEASKHPELQRACEEHLIRPRRRRVMDALQRGVERGEIRADLDLELLADLVVGPAFYRMLRSGGRPSFPAGHAELLLDALLNGIAARPQPEGQAASSR